MAIIRTVRFTADPAQAEEIIARRAELISAIRAAFAGLTEARLAKVGEDMWVDMWRWDSAANMDAALADGPSLPQAAAAFSLTRDLSFEVAELIDER
jgi:hypothetical protein